MSETEWKPRIERLLDIVKAQTLMLPHDMNTFGMVMTLAAMLNRFRDYGSKKISRRMPRPKERLPDIELADRFMDTYDLIMDPTTPEPHIANHRPAPPGRPEEITERRMAQIACAARPSRNPGRIQNLLFLAKIIGAPVDFEFAEFPACPYSVGIRKHLEEGHRLGLWRYGVRVAVTDTSLAAKADAALVDAVRWLIHPNHGTNAEGLAAAILYQFSRQRWGPRMYMKLIEHKASMCKHWGRGRNLTHIILRKSTLDLSFLPAGLPHRLMIPAAKRMTNDETVRTVLLTWWMDVLGAILKRYRRNRRVSANGLWSLWPPA